MEASQMHPQPIKYVRFVHDIISLVQVARALEWAMCFNKALLSVTWPNSLDHIEATALVIQNEQVLFRGLRAAIGICADFPSSIVLHGSNGRADYFGVHVNRAARVLAGACGGQILIPSDNAEQALRFWDEAVGSNRSSFGIHAVQPKTAGDSSRNCSTTYHLEPAVPEQQMLHYLSSESHTSHTSVDSVGNPVIPNDTVGQEQSSAATATIVKSTCGGESVLTNPSCRGEALRKCEHTLLCHRTALESGAAYQPAHQLGGGSGPTESMEETYLPGSGDTASHTGGLQCSGAFDDSSKVQGCAQQHAWVLPADPESAGVERGGEVLQSNEVAGVELAPLSRKQPPEDFESAFAMLIGQRGLFPHTESIRSWQQRSTVTGSCCLSASGRIIERRLLRSHRLVFSDKQGQSRNAQQHSNQHGQPLAESRQKSRLPPALDVTQDGPMAMMDPITRAQHAPRFSHGGTFHAKASKVCIMCFKLPDDQYVDQQPLMPLELCRTTRAPPWANQRKFLFTVEVYSHSRGLKNMCPSALCAWHQ